MFLVGIMVFSLLISGCKKDSDEADPTPQPENPKGYLGTTEQDRLAELGTAEIGGVLYLVSYSLDLVYYDTIHQSSYEKIVSTSISSGIVQFNGTTFLYNDSDLTITGTLENTDGNLNGSYTWKYDGTNTYTGQYNTVKQETGLLSTLKDK